MVLGLARLRFRLVADALLAGLALLVATPAHGYDVQRSANGALLRYANRPVAVYVVYKGAPLGLTPATVHKAVLGAIGAWTAVAGTQIPVAYGGLITEPSRYDISVQFDAAYAIGDGDVLAKTLRHTNAAGELVRTDIVINNRDVQWTAGPLKGSAQVAADLQGVLTHQIGHALGLGHSRDTTATMYFYGTASSIRSLSADDAAGARFLWPKDGKRPPTAQLCDGCDGDTDCSSALCLAWPDGARHCAQACETHDDCPIGASCGTYGTGAAAGQACLPNEGHCKPDAAVASTGDACASDSACVKGFCMPGGDVGFCTNSCKNCSAPGQCVTTTVGGLCLVAGSGIMGAQCWLPGNCQSFLCSPSIAGGGHCSRSCASGCPSGWACDDKNVCAPAKNPSGLPVGWPCKSGFDCAGGKCATTSGGRFERVCSQSCQLASDCPSGTGCSTTGETSMCLPPMGAQPSAGVPCPASGFCGSTLVCDEGLLDSVGACRNLCAPFSPANPCLSGEVCAFVGALSSGQGACRPAVGGSRPYGAACTAQDPCRADLVCATASKPPLATDSAGTCRADCDLQSASGCESGEVCVPVSGQNRGACLPAAPKVAQVTQVVAKVVKMKNFAALAVNLPKTVRSSLWKYTPPPAPPPADDGCAASATAPHNRSVALLVLVFASLTAMGGRRRRG